MLKLFPHALGCGLSEDELTQEQWQWLECQLLLDDGIDACPACDALSRGAYCPACGERMVPEGRLCERCQTPGLGAYCMHCGAPLVSQVAEAIEEERFDWQAWAESLTPFLGGLSAREQALLQHNGVPDALQSGPEHELQR